MSTTLLRRRSGRDILDEKLRKCVGAESQLLTLLERMKGVEYSYDTYLKVVQKHIHSIANFLTDVHSSGKTKNRVVKAIIDCGYHMMANDSTPGKISMTMLWMIKSINRYKIALYEAEREFAASIRNESLASFFSSALIAESQFAKEFDRLSDQLGRSALGLQFDHHNKISELC